LISLVLHGVANTKKDRAGHEVRSRNATSIADAAHGAAEPGPERVQNGTFTGGRSPPVPIETGEASLLSWRGDFRHRRGVSPLSPIAPGEETSRFPRRPDAPTLIESERS
jgi:hypothetical protein